MPVTKKSLVQRLTAPDTSVTATIIGTHTTLTEWPELEAELKAAGWRPRNGGAVYDAPDSNKYFLRPAVHRVRVGRFIYRGSGGQYTFAWEDATGMRDSGGALTDLKVSADGEALELEMYANNQIRYSITHPPLWVGLTPYTMSTKGATT